MSQSHGVVAGCCRYRNGESGCLAEVSVWRLDGEDDELVLAGVRIGTLTSRSRTAAPASEVVPEGITFLTLLVVLVVLSDVCSQL